MKLEVYESILKTKKAKNGLRPESSFTIAHYKNGFKKNELKISERGISNMMIDCPECGKNNDLDWEDLPHLACDDCKYECVHCEHVFLIGWYATAEIR